MMEVTKMLQKKYYRGEITRSHLNEKYSDLMQIIYGRNDSLYFGRSDCVVVDEFS